MSSLAFLVTELQSLASETRRKHPEVREAAERSLAILRSSPEQATANLAQDGVQANELLRPVFMGCATKNAKVVGISLGSLHRLISLKAVPFSAVPLIVQTMQDCMSQGVDIQLRILQTLLSLVTNFPAIHGELLGDSLLLCFKLQESRIAVVASTAAATLRQLVMFVVDKVVDEDRKEAPDTSRLSEVVLPGGEQVLLGPSARDAYAIFEDLCLLANSEKPHFLRLDYLHKTLALELIESVLANYHELFRKHPELLALVRHHLCPLLLKALSDRPMFPLSLRATRVVFLLLKQFSTELETEAEVFFMLLIRTIAGDSESSMESGARPSWMRVLALEIMRGLCTDAELMRNVWTRYDAPEQGSKVFSSLVTALKRLITEKPAVLGVGTQMLGLGISAGSDASLDTVGGVAGMVANAATATMSGVVGMIAGGPGLSLSSAMKLQCIDQLDKADAPPIPEAYIYLLGLQCLVSLCEGLASFVTPLYTSLMIQKPRAPGDAAIRAPPALDLSAVSASDKAMAPLLVVHAMVEAVWPALLAALSFVANTNLSDELFAEALASLQAITNVAGMLGLSTPRDAFITSLARLALPARVVAAVDAYAEPATPRTATSITDNLGFTGPSQPPGLSERNMACLKVLVSSAVFLAGSLNESWFDVLEALQNAEYVITFKGTKPAGSRPSQSAVGTGTRSVSQATNATAVAKHPLLADLDPDSIQIAIQRLFDSSKNMEDGAFKEFVSALCRLSGEMVGMQSENLLSHPSNEDLLGSPNLSPIHEHHRRRVSGIHLQRTLRSGDFGVNKLGGVAQSNVHRLIYRSPEVAWNPITSHLLLVLRSPASPPSIRVQAARILDDILLVVPRNSSSTGDLKAEVQRRMLDVLAQQIIPTADSTTTGTELRRMGLETLHQILQASGHTLLVGWETIFDMLSSVCKPIEPSRPPSITLSPLGSPATPKPKPPPLGYINEKGYTALVKIAFQSLTLVCDALSGLSPQHLRLCIATLGSFGRQADTNIALTAAESLLWSVSDAIQARRREAADEAEEYSELWMALLHEVLGLCTDARMEVRVGAIQTLFRTLQLYGATLSLSTWDKCVWEIVIPLLDSVTISMRAIAGEAPTQGWDESKILALQSIGTIFGEFLPSKIIHLESFSRAWDNFVERIQDTVLRDNQKISASALRCLEKAVKAAKEADAEWRDKQEGAWSRTWRTCDEIGTDVLSESRAPSSGTSFTQECLIAYVDVIRATRDVSRSLNGSEWPLDRLTRLTAILKGVMMHSGSSDYRPDIDSLSPLQAIIMDAIAEIDLSCPGSPSLVLRDLADFTTLAFLAAFDVPTFDLRDNASTPAKSAHRKRVTYIALTKKTMPMLVELYTRFKNDISIYLDGTLESILAAYAIPIKLKYDCPQPSKFGKDLPLWKTATRSFLKVVQQCAVCLREMDDNISSDRLEGIWRQIVDVFRGGILADCSVAETFPIEVQEEEENFDLSLVAALEIDVIPHLGTERVPESLVTDVARMLQNGSRLQEFDGSPALSSSTADEDVCEDHRKVTNFAGQDAAVGSVRVGMTVPRERFAYWCLDLLFLICSDTAKDQEASRRRVAALSITPLLARCRNTLVTFVADEAIRGSLPFARVREEELLYVLQKLLELKLWPETFSKALASTSSAEISPGSDEPESPSQVIAKAVKRSSRAHLFQLYPILCEIASIPRRAPTAWVASGLRSRDGKGLDESVEERDARSLARECLRVIGREMGMER